MGEGIGVYTVLVGRPEGKRPLEDLSVIWRITLRWTLGNWSRLALNRVQWRAFVNTVMDLRVP
jgi:hypothetical protein